MRIRSNLQSLIAWRAFSAVDNQLGESIRRLSSGQRVNRAADDVASFSISQNLMAQRMGLIQANRNALDGKSIIDVAESALHEITALVQRGRELAVQAANGTLSDADRPLIQREIDSLVDEIDRISQATEVNGRRLLNASGVTPEVAATVRGLRSGWLKNARDVIFQQYGLLGDASEIKVVLETGMTTATRVTGTAGPDGRLNGVEIHIDIKAFGSVVTPDGGIGPFYNDRKVAMALTEAVLARRTDITTLRGDAAWFISGSASLIAGFDEELAATKTAYGSTAIVNALNTPWVDDALHRSAAYVAVKYLNDQLGANGYTMADFMNRLQTLGTLDAALNATLGIGLNAFKTDFRFFGGVPFLNSLNLTDADVGGIHPGDARSVIPNGAPYNLNPLAPDFQIIWGQQGLLDPVKLTLQVGANYGDTMDVEIQHVSALSLNLYDANVVRDARGAITLFDLASKQISAVRSQLGANSNRLDHTIEMNGQAAESQLRSYSQIVDLDFARELIDFTRHKIVAEAASSMLAHANVKNQAVLWLLSGSGSRMTFA